MEGIKNTLLAPFTFVLNLFGGTFGGISNAIGSGFSGAIQGGFYAMAAGSLGYLFKPTIESALVSWGKPEWWSAIAPYLQAPNGMLPFMTQAFGAGALVGGSVGALSGAASTLGSAFSAVSTEAQNGFNPNAMAQNTGQALGNSVAVVGALVLGGIAYEKMTGKKPIEELQKLFSAAGDKLPELSGKLDVATTDKVEKPTAVFVQPSISIGTIAKG